MRGGHPDSRQQACRIRIHGRIREREVRRLEAGVSPGLQDISECPIVSGSGLRAACSFAEYGPSPRANGHPMRTFALILMMLLVRALVGEPPRRKSEHPFRSDAPLSRAAWVPVEIDGFSVATRRRIAFQIFAEAFDAAPNAR